MSLEDRSSLDQSSEESDVVPKKPVLSYSREFLLSFSSLDICKKLPIGFDESILSEFEDALLSTGDRPRIPGSLPLQGYRRNEYGSSPPTRGDSGNYSRGAYGKWDSHSSGRSDRDSDSQPDRDAESGRRYGHQPRRSWQSPEHDGLLGSGSFPKPSGYSAGVSGLKVHTNEQYQLSKSREPYHPPRPYKAVPHSRRDTDAYNDETFGSIESASEDKVEEERRRRASFELIRKEQQKALQEKQKSKMEKHNDSGISDLNELLEDDKDEKEPFVASKESEVSAASVLGNNLEKPSFPLHSPASKRVVPPGFCNNIQDKSSELKSLILPSSSEVAKPVKERSLLDVEVNLIQNGKADVNVVGQPAEATHHTNLSNRLDKPKLHGSIDVPLEKLSYKDDLFPISSHFEADGSLKDPEIPEQNAEVLNDKIVGDFKGSDSSSILEKIFGSTLSVHDSSNSAEHDDGKPDDVRSHSSAQSSKFAQWFFEEEDNVTNNISTARPNDLLSLIVTGDKANVKSDPIYVGSKEEVVPTVLTCEDLEQSILSESSADSKNMQPLINSWSSNGASTDQPVEHVDNRASLHLLSMLHKSTENNTSMRSGDEVNMTNMTNVLPVSHNHDMDPKVETNNQSSHNLGRPLTLETLFGNAFMEELQSVGAPVSVQRGPIGSALADVPQPREIPYQFPDIENSSQVANGIQRSGLDGSSDNVNLTKQSKNENWIGLVDPQIEIVSSNASSVNVIDKMAAFGVGFNDFGSEVRRISFDKLDHQIPHRNIPPQQSSSPQFGPQQMNQGWPPFHHLEPHYARMSSSAKFLGPDPIYHNNPHLDQQFPPNMIRPPPFHHLNPGFDAPPRHPMLHQMQMPGNYAPHVQINHMQGLPLQPNLPNLGGHPMPGPETADIISKGAIQYEAFERLIGMKLRANSNQIHSFPHGHDSAGYGADMGFQYR